MWTTVFEKWLSLGHPLFEVIFTVWFGLVYWDLTPQQQPGSYQGGEIMMMKSVFWWRKPGHPDDFYGPALNGK